MSDIAASEEDRLNLARSLGTAPLPREPPRRSPRKRLALTGKHPLLIVLSLLTLAPIVLLLSTTFKTGTDVKVNPFGLFTSFSFDNIVKAWTDGHFSDFGDLAVGQPLDVAQYHRLSVWGRQSPDGRLQTGGVGLGD